MSYRTLTVDALAFKAAIEGAKAGRHPLAVADLLLAALRPTLECGVGAYEPKSNPFAEVGVLERAQLVALL